jgi:hypothetical protein
MNEQKFFEMVNNEVSNEDMMIFSINHYYRDDQSVLKYSAKLMTRDFERSNHSVLISYHTSEDCKNEPWLIEASNARIQFKHFGASAGECVGEYNEAAQKLIDEKMAELGLLKI